MTKTIHNINTLQLLRFNTCGSVDDGKSTLIGRLLYDSKSLKHDQIETLERLADKNGREDVDLASITDGLRSEREQGITIDVAYRYFSTPRREFIVADTPGHIQYTRNMVTGASTAHLSVVLVDARQGVTEQTRRHTYIASLLRIPHVVFAINKMDLLDWEEGRFLEIKKEIEALLLKFEAFKDVVFIPISALNGDNIVEKSARSPWFVGPTLLHHLETVEVESHWNFQAFRFPVQWVNRPNAPRDEVRHDFRGLSGQIAAGSVKVGDQIMVLPGNLTSTIKKIWTYDGELQEAFCPKSVTLVLDDDVDSARGDTIVGISNPPHTSTHLRARVCWMNQRSLSKNKKYFIKHGTQTVQAVVADIENRVSMDTFELEKGQEELVLNSIGTVLFTTAKQLVYDTYENNRSTGSFIIIDQATNETLGVGMIV